MLLAYRNWTPEHDRTASRALREGVRWALFVEKAVVMLAEAEKAAATSLDPRTATRETVMYQQAGAKDARRLRPILFPVDDDG